MPPKSHGGLGARSPQDMVIMGDSPFHFLFDDFMLLVDLIQNYSVTDILEKSATFLGCNTSR